MDCTTAQSLFTTCADQELDAATAGPFHEHLASCAGCQREWELFQQTLHHLQGLGPVPPPDILSGVHQKLGRQSLIEKIRHGWHRLDFSMSLPAAAATVAMAMVTAVFFKAATLPNHNNPPSPEAVSTKIARSSSSLPGRKESPLEKTGLPPLSATNDPRQYSLVSREAAPAHRPPDILVSLRPTQPEEMTTLYKRLADQKNWQTDHVGSALMIRLPAGHLPLLQQMLSRHRVTVSPSEAAGPVFDSRKHQLVVVIRLH